MPLRNKQPRFIWTGNGMIISGTGHLNYPGTDLPSLFSTFSDLGVSCALLVVTVVFDTWSFEMGLQPMLWISEIRLNNFLVLRGSSFTFRFSHPRKPMLQGQIAPFYGNLFRIASRPI